MIGRSRSAALHGRPCASTRGFGRGLLLGWGLLGGALGCSVDTLEVPGGTSTRNECSEHRECGDGGRCVAGQCRAESGEIEALLLEVTPPADASGIAGVRFVHALADLDPMGGDVSVELGHVARVHGFVSASLEGESCVVGTSLEGDAPSLDGSVPARVTLTPRPRQLGVASPSHTSDAVFSDGGYRFSASVPPGNYDIYVEPRDVEGECVRPPHLFLDRAIGAGDVELRLKLALPEPLTVQVRWPDPETTLDGWELDVIERDSGRLLSTRGVLEQPEVTESGLVYRVPLSYAPADPPGTGVELVRLSPPAGLTAPQIIVDRTVVELFEEGQGIIDQLRSLPRPVQVMGQVSAQYSAAPVAATVNLTATELRMISPGTVAAFERVVETDGSGQFAVELLPGTYRVVAYPPVGSGLSPTEAVWQISANQDVQAGRVVELASSAEIRARVLAPGRGAIAGASVQAAAAAGMSAGGVLDRALGRTSYTPQAEGVVTDTEGRFVMIADRGAFDLWVRPGVGSGFAWLVLPGLEAQTAGVPLGDLRLPLPIEYTGVVRSADLGGGISAALVRAYAYVKGTTLTNDPSEATAVIQVAESRTGSGGEFQLLLPARLSAP